jgi:hypothetical protein
VSGVVQLIRGRRRPAECAVLAPAVVDFPARGPQDPTAPLCDRCATCARNGAVTSGGARRATTTANPGTPAHAIASNSSP